ncbi:MAG: FtsX-like permease family protein [Longimicrobiaceae bacterium]
MDTEHVLTMRTSLTGSRYEGAAARLAAFERIAARVESLPGVRAAAWSLGVPGSDAGGVGTTIVAEGQPRAPGEELAIRYLAATPGVFRAFGAPLLAGRDFTAREAADSTSTHVILGQGVARRLWPGQDPLGKRVQLVVGERTPWLTVVGIAPDLRYEEPGDGDPQAALHAYLPYARAASGMMTLVVRTAGDPAATAPAVRREVRAVDPALPVWDVRTMRETQAYAAWNRRLMGEIFGSFGVLALVLATLGVYGVMAYAVSQRTREIGIRMALGAQAADVLRMVVGRGAVIAAAGVGAGLLGAFAVSRVMRGILFGVQPGDPLTFGAVAALLLATALLASWLPARRAARVDPLTALRTE